LKTKPLKIEEFKLASDTYSGLVIGKLDAGIKANHDIHDAHRDDHFNLMFALTGNYSFNIDFEEVILQAPFVLCIEPKKIHRLVGIHEQSGWIIAMDEFLLEAEFKKMLLTKLNSPLILESSSELLLQIKRILNLTYDLQNNAHNLYNHKSCTYLINALFCLLVDPAGNTSENNSKETRGQIIEYAFSELLRSNYKKWKKPSEYAFELAITTSHLNDVLKEKTGSSTSTLIHQHIILEAKRLLYATDKEVREIAYELGYEDVVYFSKFFKKTTDQTCLQFRKQFRD
jgi:AraC-type DNA-binding domain-containing proteins